MQDPQSLHKYAYVHGDPVQGSDPSGESAIFAVFTALDFIGVHYEAVTAGYEAHLAGLDGIEGYKFGLIISAATGVAAGAVASVLTGPLGRIVARIARVNSGYWVRRFKAIRSRFGSRFEHTALPILDNGLYFLRQGG